MAQILDHRGQPIRNEVLTAPQTARVGSLIREFAEHPSRGLTPAKLAQILEDAERGDIKAQCELFEDMEEKDGHILAEMGKRKRSLLGLTWDIVPPRDASAKEEQAAERARQYIQDIPDMEDLLLDLLDAIGKGFACAEIAWLRDGREWMPESIDARPPAWFKVLPEARDTLRLRDNTPEGQLLQPFGWITHVHKAKSGYLTRGGLHRCLAWPYLFKNYSVRDLGEFLEIYGLPLRLGTYPHGASDQEKATLLRAVVNIGHAAAGIIPEGMMIDFKEAAKGASGPFEAMIAWCERTVSKAVLGGTLTSQADGKSSTNALGNVHNEVRWDLTVSDARQLASTLTRDLVYPLLALNIGGIDNLRRCPRFVFDTREPEDLALYADAIPKLVDIGLPVPVSWAQEKLNIPTPDKDEPVLGRAAPTPPPIVGTRRTGCPRCGGRAALKAGDPDPTIVGAQLDALDHATTAPIEAMLTRIRTLLDEADSLEAFQTRLLETYPDLSTDQLAEAMTEALAAAALAGRFDILEQAGG